MYSVLIAEDEILFVGTHHSVPWKEMDMYVSGSLTAKRGAVAEASPRHTITDLNMPEMDGLVDSRYSRRGRPCRHRGSDVP